MKLNIITTLYRKDFLLRQYETIPKFANVNWIICKTKSWGELPSKIIEDKRFNLIVSEVDCEDNLKNWIPKISEGLKKAEDGFFLILDDDNAIHPNLYPIFEKFKNDKYEMIIGDQVIDKKLVYLKAHIPQYLHIDMGNVLCKTNVLKKINYFYCIDPKKLNPKWDGYDYAFWIECYKTVGGSKTLLLKNIPIAYYNKLRMAAVGVHKITEEFERLVSEYTKAPFCVAIDNCSNALFLSLLYEKIRGKKVGIPSRTYPSVPCEIIHAGGIVDFYPVEGKIKGEYQLLNTKVFDSALRFTSGMYRKGFTQCLSFSGPHKHLKLGKGGMILTDDPQAYLWYKKARFSGRGECSYHDDNFNMLGWNFYMIPEIAAKGIGLMAGIKEHNEDLELLYPDLSKFNVYTRNR